MFNSLKKHKTKRCTRVHIYFIWPFNS